LHLVSTSFSPRSRFAYLTDLPLTYTREGVFGLWDGFFGSKGIPMEGKMKLAKKTFVKTNANTCRGQSSSHIFNLTRLTRLPDISHLKLVMAISESDLSLARPTGTLWLLSQA
jgi:hypothetical protein